MKLEDLRSGIRLSPSAWLEVDQARIGAFADATDDHQWIHTDPERAVSGPYGTTIAHVWLTLALVAPFTAELPPLDASALVNYGLDRLRFRAPVPSGSRVRATFDVAEVNPIEGGIQVEVHATIEREGDEKPACVAHLLFRAYE